MLPKKCDPAHIPVTVSMESGYLYPTILQTIFFPNHEHITICSLWTEVVVYQNEIDNLNLDMSINSVWDNHLIISIYVAFMMFGGCTLNLKVNL